MTGIHPEGRGQRCDFWAAIPATFDAMEKVFTEFRRHWKPLMPGGDCFACELLLREALTNAVVHGCQGDPLGTVRCVLRLKTKRLVIGVEDDGAGFAWRTRRNRDADICACSGRGLEIFRKFATRVRFNEKGNTVVIIKDFGRG